MIVARNLPWAIILEDDAAVTEHLPALIHQLNRQYWPDWDYLKLANPVRPRRWRRICPGRGVDLVAYEKVPSCTVAQVVSLAGAKKLLSGSECFSRPIDIDLQYPWEFDLSIYGVKPDPFLVHAFDSDIDVIGVRGGNRIRHRLGIMRKLDHRFRLWVYNRRCWGGDASNWPSC